MCRASSVAPVPNSNKKVRFVEFVKVKVISSRKELTEEEVSSTYFSSNDLSRIRKRERRLAKALSEGELLDDSDHDLFGITSKESKLQRKKRVVDGVLSVLLEQELQYAHYRRSPLDHEYIAKIYSQTALESRVLAYHRGLSNAANVTENLLSTGGGAGEIPPNHLKSAFEPVRSTTTNHHHHHPPNHSLFRWSNEITDSALVPVSHAFSPFPTSRKTLPASAMPMEILPTRSVE